MKTGNTHLCPTLDLAPLRPQWSPVTKTGNTIKARKTLVKAEKASMEPGHEDREYHQSKEDTGQSREGLNGARS